MAGTFRLYFAKKVIYLAVTIFLILSFNFLLFRVMPGDVTRIVIPKGVGNETIAELREFYGLDESIPSQYVTYLSNFFLHGELGQSLTVRRGSEVVSILGPYVLNTVILVGIGTVLSIWVGVALGSITAWKRGKAADRVGSAFFIVFYCMPTFLFGLIIITIVGRYAPEWPIKGAFGDEYWNLDLIGKIGDRIIHMLLPMLALVVETIATFSIITRSALIDVMTEDYMMTAVAKGLRSREVLHDHAMPNAMLPVVTVIAMNVGWVMSGSIMIEIIFSYPGLGYLTWDAVWNYDYPVMQAIFMLEAVAVLIANFIADMALFRLDPRVKL